LSAGQATVVYDRLTALIAAPTEKVIPNGCRIPDGIFVDLEAGHVYWTNMGEESSERGVARGVQGGCLCFDLRSIFSFQSAIVH